jgi:protein-tyrosine phosphatase
MIDIHAHILAGLDDGPSDVRESLEMCRMAEEDGVRIIVATPHFKRGQYENSRETILLKVKELNQCLQSGGNPTRIRVLPGSDIHLNPDLGEGLKMGRLVSINDSLRYVLLELPDHFLLGPTRDFIGHLIADGTIPIISHPERNTLFQHHMEILCEFVKLGALSQITAMSITGGFGREARKFAEELLAGRLVQVIASDCHSAGTRPPILSRAVAAAARILGRDVAESMVEETPKAIIEGKPVIHGYK